ncbi:MAG: hypothetical protein ABI870_14110, partial [Rhodanobacter sp.]
MGHGFTSRQRLNPAAKQHNCGSLGCARCLRHIHTCGARSPPQPLKPMSASYSAETLLLEGPDAVAFAHAQFSSNVTALAIGDWQFSAWLDAQGRVQAFFQLARMSDDRLLLLLRGGDAVAIIDALRRFVFRSKLTLTALPPRALGTGPSLQLHAVRSEEGMFSLGCGDYSLQIKSASAGDDDWREMQLRDGWPWLPSSTLNELLPPSLSLQRLLAVVVDKGCYPGQEIVARMHYRGGHKRHMHSVVLSQQVAAGEVLRENER